MRHDADPAAMTSPGVCAVVLNWCGEDDTVACVESLRQSTYQQLDILVVDNGSPDGSGARLQARFPNLPFIQTGHNLGYAGGNNRGITAALERGAAYVLVLNNDTEVDARCVELLVETAEQIGAGVVAPKILYHATPDIIWYGGGDFSVRRVMGVHREEGAADDPARRDSQPISFATGCCFLARADVVRAIGGFDESYFAYAEDVEFSLRVQKAGWAMRVDPRARVYHKIPVGRLDQTPFEIEQRDRNRRRLARQHLTAMQRAVFAAWFYPTRGAHLLRYLLRGSRAQARAIIVGAFGALDDGLPNASAVQTRRRLSAS